MAIRYRITKRTNSIQNKKEQYIMQAITTGMVERAKIFESCSKSCSIFVVKIGKS